MSFSYRFYMQIALVRTAFLFLRLAESKSHFNYFIVFYLRGKAGRSKTSCVLKKKKRQFDLIQIMIY